MVGNVTYYVDTGYPAKGYQYYWWVIAYAGGTVLSDYNEVIANGFSFTNPYPPIPDAPILTLPANGGADSGDSVRFEWTPVAGATNYKLIVNTTNNLYYSGRKTSLMVGNVAYYDDTGYPSIGTVYYWWVIAYAGDTVHSDYNQVIANGFSFTNSAEYTLGTPTLTLPAFGASVAGNSVRFEWTPVDGAVNYKLIVNRTNNLYFAGRKTEVMVGNVTYYVDTGYPAMGYLYYWWVVAYDATGVHSPYNQVIANGYYFINPAA
jgi:hypothetical protein